MTFEGTVKWVEAHPTESIIIGGASVIALLWLLGAFGGSKSADSGSSSLASAYYAAEAQQAVVGGQIQQANIAATAATAQMGLQTDAAVKINEAQTGAAVTINGQNANAATTIGNQQLLATYSNDGAAVQMNASNNAALVQANYDSGQASQMNNFISNVLPTELATYGQLGFTTNVGNQKFSSGQWSNPSIARASGYSESQIARMYGGA
jgi:hypothetical protein